MDYFELTKTRCSYRGNYTSKKIPKQDITKILSTALLAPTGMNAQSTEFVVIDDTGKINEIGRILGKDFISGASHIILCIVNAMPRMVNSLGLTFEIEDCSAAVMSMLLAITELGYASVWIDGLLRRDNNAERIAEIIKLPESKKIQILLPVGEPASAAQQPQKKTEEERISFNTYTL